LGEGAGRVRRKRGKRARGKRGSGSAAAGVAAGPPTSPGSLVAPHPSQSTTPSTPGEEFPLAAMAPPPSRRRKSSAAAAAKGRTPSSRSRADAKKKDKDACVMC